MLCFGIYKRKRKNKGTWNGKEGFLLNYLTFKLGKNTFFLQEAKHL